MSARNDVLLRVGAVAVLLLLGILGLLPVTYSRVQSPAPPYVFLLDVSGSMEREGGVRYLRYSSGQVRELVAQVLRSIRIRDSAPVVVQPFSSSGDAYPPSAALTSEPQLAAAIPTMAPGRETELDYALRLGLERWPGSMLFLVTDNKNDFLGNRSDRNFYMALARERRINQVFLVPLGRPEQSSDALVLYLIVSRNEQAADAKAIIENFAAAERSEPLHFRGFYQSAQSLSLSKELLQVGEDGEERPAEEEGDAAVLRYDEGQALHGAIRFRIRSNLKHWRIVEGQLEPARAQITVPPAFQNSGDFEPALPFAGTRKINVAPGGQSAEIYTLSLETIDEQGVRLARSSFFTRSLPDVVANVHITAIIHVSPDPAQSGLRPAISESLKRKMQAVSNLTEIMNEMTFSADADNQSAGETRKMRFDRTLLVRVKPNPVKNTLAAGVIYGFPGMAVLGLIVGALLLRSTVCTIIGPDKVTRTVAFSAFKRQAIVQWKQRRVARIDRGMNGNFRVTPERGYAADPRNLVKLPARFEVQDTRSQERGAFELAPKLPDSRSTAKTIRGG